MIFKRLLSNYVQGQFRGKSREYFYFVDHQGMLFLDDSRIKNFTSAFKEKTFLNFFFKNLKHNKSDITPRDSFPFVSHCGPEINYVRCNDKTPIVFTHLDSNLLTINHTTNMNTVFSPEKLFVSPGGHIYHPTGLKPPRVQIGLVKYQLALEMFEFVFEGGKVTGVKVMGGRVTPLDNGDTEGVWRGGG